LYLRQGCRRHRRELTGRIRKVEKAGRSATKASGLALSIQSANRKEHRNWAPANKKDQPR
jgi:hypothetical protein